MPPAFPARRPSGDSSGLSLGFLRDPLVVHVPTFPCRGGSVRGCQACSYLLSGWTRMHFVKNLTSVFNVKDSGFQKQMASASAAL